MQLGTQPSPKEDAQALTLKTALKRIASLTFELGLECLEIQEAVGALVDPESNLNAMQLRKLQRLDHLHQRLLDLSGLQLHLVAQLPQDAPISMSELDSVCRLHDTPQLVAGDMKIDEHEPDDPPDYFFCKSAKARRSS